MVGCQMHSFRELSEERGEVDPRVWDEEAWYRSMERLGEGDEVGGRLFLEARWCGVCPALARFKCCSSQSCEHSELGGGVYGEEEEEGCGLLLCTACCDLVALAIKGGHVSGKDSLDAIIGERKQFPIKYSGGVRADAEFLTSEGELMSRLAQGMGGFGSECEGEESESSPAFEPGFKSACKMDRGKGKEKERSFEQHRGNTTSSSSFRAKINRVNTPSSSAFEAEDENPTQETATQNQRKAPNLPEHVRASGKRKERSKWFDCERGVWGEGEGEVEVLVLSDDE